MKIFLKKIMVYVKKHKLITSIVIAVLLVGSYYTYTKISGSSVVTQYTFGKVTKGDLIVSVSGSGQVSTLSKVSIKPNTTGQTQTLGQITSVKVKNGDTVKAGQVVAILDGKNALQTLNQAKASVASAQANYNKLINGPTESDLQSLKNSIQSSQTSLENQKQNILIKLQSAYTSAANSVYLNTDPFFLNPLGINAQISVTDVYFINQQLETGVNSGRVTVGNILASWKTEVNNANTSNDLSVLLTNAISNLSKIRNYFDDMTMLFGVYGNSNSTSGVSSVSSNKGIASSARSSADSSISDLTSTLQSFNNAKISLEQSQKSLDLKIAPPSQDDVTVSKSQLDNAQANYANAIEAYSSRIITAPFDGQIGGLSAEVGQQVSSSDSLGTLITSEKVINVTLNEVDAAKVIAGSSVVITFDSLPGVSITGRVNYIDPLGTVTQGVVSYSVQIKMDEQNDQIKTAMTASVSIVTTKHSNTLIIPTSAITTTGGKKYVLVADTSSSSIQNLGEDFSQSSTTKNFASSSRRNFASSTFSSTTRASSSRQFGNFSASNTKVSSSITSQYPVISVEITTGISNNTSTEVLSGLSEGQLIVTKKTTVNSTTTTTKTSASSATTNTRSGFGGIGGPGL